MTRAVLHSYTHSAEKDDGGGSVSGGEGGDDAGDGAGDGGADGDAFVPPLGPSFSADDDLFDFHIVIDAASGAIALKPWQEKVEEVCTRRSKTRG